jgi:hypothetical protein
LSYGLLLHHGDEIAVNISRASHDFKLSADEGVAEAQLNYGLMFAQESGTSMKICKTYLTEYSSYKNVHYFLRGFLVQIIRKFMRKHRGVGLSRFFCSIIHGKLFIRASMNVQDNCLLRYSTTWQAVCVTL